MTIDYRDFQGTAKATGSGSYWWEDNESKAHERVIAAAKFLDEQQSYRTASNLRHARLYGNFDQMGFGLRDYSRSMSFGGGVNRMSLNIVSSCIDTLAAKIAKNRPRPSFQTFGGSWDNRIKAKKLDKFCQGKFYELKLHELGAKAFVDSLVFDAGIVKFYEMNGRVCAERVLPEEIRVDDADGIHGTPRQLFQTKSIAREVLLSAYGDTEAMRLAIVNAKRPGDATGIYRGFGDMVEVREAWHLPSGEGADDGKHVIVIDGATLFEEKWTKQYFPFVFERFSSRLIGFWGQGLAERLTGVQMEINRLLREVNESLRLVSKPRVFVEGDANIVKAHINNDIGTIISFRGTPPIFSAANVVPPEQFTHLERLKAWAYEEASISQLSATQQKPAGLDSGAALREYGDSQSERFSLVTQGHDTFFMDSTRVMLDMTRDIYIRTGKYEVQVPGRKFVESIDWKEVDLAADEYVMQMFPISSLPTTPAARTATVQEWIQAGFVDAVEGRRLLDFPDLEQSTNLAVAAWDDVDATIDKILIHGDYMPPEEFQDLELLLQRGQAAYLKARHEECPENHLEKMRTLLLQTGGLIAAKAQAKAQAANANAPGQDAAAMSAQDPNATTAQPGPGMPPVGPDAALSPSPLQ